MGDEVKKISFGFSKLSKKTSIVSSKSNQTIKEESKVELIDCLEGKTIMLKEPVKDKNTVLVIPLKRQQQDISIVKEASTDVKSVLETPATEVGLSDNKYLKPTEPRETDNTDYVSRLPLDGKIGEKTLELEARDKSLTLDEIAAREILAELNEKKDQEESHIFSVPLTSNAPTGENESSLDDYENVPIKEYGMAMLRGMGWAPGKGIGKNEKLVTPSMPTLRPKGMGLGADKVIKASVDTKNLNEDLKMTTGSFVRVIAGPHKDSYGQIEGFDDESGRLIVKLALKNTSISFNEFMVQLVDKTDYIKNSKVINVGKYEMYKDESANNSNETKHSEKFKERIKSETHSSSGRKSESQPDKFVTKLSKSSKTNTSSSENELSTKTTSKNKHICSSHSIHRRNQEKYNSSSSSDSDVEVTRDRRSHSKSSISHSRKKHHKKSSYKKSRDSSSESTSSLSDYSKSNKNRTRKKKPSSHRYKSRSRSNSPRTHSSHKKHKKSKY